jgi:hypothetical protein
VSVAEPLPAEYPLTLYRGDTRLWELEFTHDDDTPLDLSAYTVLAQIRATRDSADVLATFTVDDSRASDGVLRIRLDAAQTVLDVARAYWDLQLTRPDDGFVRTWLSGSVRVRGDVSRA